MSRVFRNLPAIAAASLVGLLLGVLPSSAAATASISGTVTAEDTEAPLEFVSVCIYEAGGFGSFVDCGSTDAAGDYSVTVPGADDYVAHFGAPFESGYVSEYWDDEPTFSAADPIAVASEEAKAGIDAELAPEATISGTITDADSAEPVEGIEACAYFASDQSFADCDTTDAAGTYQLTGLLGNSYKISFLPPYESNYIRQYYDEKSTFGEADAVAVTAGEAKGEVDAELQPGGRIKGQVTLASGGATLPGAWVCVYKPGAEYAERCTETNSGGNYMLQGLPTGSYQVEFGPGYSCGPEGCTQENYVRQLYDDKPSREAADLISLTAGATEEGIDAALESGGKISGRVADASTEEPVPGAWICAYRSGEEEPESCGESGEDGNYVISGLSDGSHKVEFQPGITCGPESCTENNYAVQFYDSKHSLATADPLSVTVGGNHEGIDAALIGASGSKPINIEAPQLTGTPEVGETLTCSQGTWENEPSEYDYAWRRNGAVIGGQTATSYAVQAADAGGTLRCEVTATNVDGSNTAQSNSVVVATPAPVNT